MLHPGSAKKVRVPSLVSTGHQEGRGDECDVAGTVGTEDGNEHSLGSQR